MLRGFMFLLLTTLLIVGAAFYLMQNPDAAKEREQEELAAQGFLTTEKDLNDTREEYKRRKQELVTQIERMEQREDVLTKAFRKKAITKAEDIESDEDAKRMLKDIRQYRQDVEEFKAQIVDIDKAIAAIDDGLREFDRQKLRNNVGLSEDSQKRLNTIIKDLDDRFNKEDSVLEKLEYQDLLDDINKTGGDEK